MTEPKTYAEFMRQMKAKDPKRVQAVEQRHPVKTAQELRALEAREVSAFGPGDGSAGDDKHEPLSSGALAQVKAAGLTPGEPDPDEIAAERRGELDDEDDPDELAEPKPPPKPAPTSLTRQERARVLAAERSRRYRAKRRKD